MSGRFSFAGLTWNSRRPLSLAAAAYRGTYPVQPGQQDGARTRQSQGRYGRRAPDQNGQRQLVPVPQRQPQRRPQQRRIRPPPGDDPTLSCQQVVGKQVITRTSGISLGFVKYLCTDPDTLSVVSADLRPKALSWNGAGSENLLLDTFCQIGDVVLVHDEGALDFVPQDVTLGFVDLIGCPVYNSAGNWLGKVREYTFSPDSGRVDLIKFDPLGWPAISEKLTGAWQVGVESVDNMDGNRIYLLPRAEQAMMRVSDGPLEAALVALQKLYQETGIEVTANGEEYDHEYEKWKRSYGQAFTDAFGQAPPASRAELENFYLGMEAGRQASPTPRSLPPGRQPAMADSLRASSRPNNLQREPEMVRARGAPSREDPRLRRSMQQPEPSSRQAAQRRGSPPSSSTRASIPIIDRRPPSAERQRDADGRFGEQPPAQPSSKMFDEWMDDTYQERVPIPQSSNGSGPASYRSQAYESQAPTTSASQAAWPSRREEINSSYQLQQGGRKDRAEERAVGRERSEEVSARPAASGTDPAFSTWDLGSRDEASNSYSQQAAPQSGADRPTFSSAAEPWTEAQTNTRSNVGAAENNTLQGQRDGERRIGRKLPEAAEYRARGSNSQAVQEDRDGSWRDGSSDAGELHEQRKWQSQP